MCEFLSRLEFRPPGGWLCRGYNQLLPVGGDVEGSLGVNFKKVEDRAINHQREAVSMLGKLLNHWSSVCPMYHHSHYESVERSSLAAPMSYHEELEKIMIQKARVAGRGLKAAMDLD